MRTPLTFGKTPLVSLSIIGLLCSVAVACSSEYTPQEPEGGYLGFRDALLSGDSNRLWEWVDYQTKDLYDGAYNDLVAASEAIERLAPNDRALARERTGISVLGSVQSGQDLFARMVRLENLAGDDAYLLGTEIDDVEVDTENGTATITSVTSQEFPMVLEDDGIWRCAALLSITEERVRPFSSNVAAVEMLAAENSYLRRSHGEIMRLLGQAEPPPAEALEAPSEPEDG